MEFLLIIALVCACSIFANVLLANIAPKLKLLAYPGEHRQHSQPTPLVGGLAIFIALSLGLLLLDASVAVIYPCLLLMLVVGVADDRWHLPSWVRFIFQGFCAYLMVLLTGVELSSLGQIVSNDELLTGPWSLTLTIFAMIGVINAINMSDGMDGLAGALVTLLLLALLYLMPNKAQLLLLMAAAIFGFLLFNVRIMRKQATVFLGDAGSMMLGVFFAWLLIDGSQHTHTTQAAFHPVTALWLLAIPLYDAVAVLVVRPLLGKSPFDADHSHYHHFLRGYGLSVNQVLIIVVCLQSLFILAGILMYQYNVSQALQFSLFLFGFIAYVIYLIRKLRKA